MTAQKPSWMQMRDFSPHKKNSTQYSNQQKTAPPPKKAAAPGASYKAPPQNNANYSNRARGPQVCNDNANDMWLDISAASTLEFPVPLFKGKQTKVMNVGGSFVSGSMYGRQVILQTRDSAYDVYIWYKQNLGSYGYTINEKYPAKALFGQSYMVRGDSEKEQAMVSINPQFDDKGACTHIQVSVAPKHGVRQFKD